MNFGERQFRVSTLGKKVAGTFNESHNRMAERIACDRAANSRRQFSCERNLEIWRLIMLLSSIVLFAVSNVSGLLVSESLPFRKPVEVYAWRMAGADYCEVAYSGLALNPSLANELEGKLRSLGVWPQDIEQYQLIYNLAYFDHLDRGLEENLSDGGKFCRQIESEVLSARLHAGDEFRRFLDDYAR